MEEDGGKICKQSLQDEALYQRRAAEEAAKLREFEENLRDETEFSVNPSHTHAYNCRTHAHIIHPLLEGMARKNEGIG